MWEGQCNVVAEGCKQTAIDGLRCYSCLCVMCLHKCVVISHLNWISRKMLRNCWKKTSLKEVHWLTKGATVIGDHSSFANSDSFQQALRMTWKPFLYCDVFPYFTVVKIFSSWYEKHNRICFWTVANANKWSSWMRKRFLRFSSDDKWDDLHFDARPYVNVHVFVG